MSNGVKFLRILGGIVEVGFVLSFVYEIGKEIGQKEQKELDSAEQTDGSIDVNDLVEILKSADKNVFEKITFK